MGFLEYAWSIFFEKDKMKTKLLVSKTTFSQLSQDDSGFVCVFPEPTSQQLEEEKTVSMFGYTFPADAQGVRQLVSLFRASVFHLGAHVLSSNFGDYREWKKKKDRRLINFTISLLEDARANAYIVSFHPDKLADIALANVLALKRLKRIDKMVNPATKIMASLLIRENTGLIVEGLKKELSLVVHLGELLDQYREKVMVSIKNEEANLKQDELRVAEEIYNSIKDEGIVTESPFLPHTEELGACSIFLGSHPISSDMALEDDFKRCLGFLGGSLKASQETEQLQRRASENEATQVYDLWRRQNEKETKMLSKYERLLPLTKFRSVSVPEQDYTEFLRIRSRCKSEAHRLMDSLLVTRDALDEDPRKVYGVLDLQEVIQIIASKSPSVDVFMLDENLSKSYSWIILFDASKSMDCTKELGLELFLMLTEVANELLLDPYSWAAYAFNDRLLVIKDLKERYNTRLKARIGGIRFEGLTYMPDALTLAGQIIKTRAENMKLITIVSDGWPYGYADMDTALKETLDYLTGKNISIIGIGAQSRQMECFFKSCSTVYSLRDLTKRFSNLYFEASNAVSEA